MIGPTFSEMLPKNRHIDEGQALVIDNHVNSGISIRETYESMSWAVGGRQNLTFLKDDLKNYIQTKRQLEMIPGEATVITNWLREQSLTKPGFYYDIQVDDKEELTSMFWADPTMISDYSLFGDFVSFDTTHRTNNKYRPLGMTFYRFLYLIILYMCVLQIIHLFWAYYDCCIKFQASNVTIMPVPYCPSSPFLVSRINVYI